MTDHLESLSRSVDTYEIDSAASGAVTVFTPSTGSRFVVYHVWLQAEAGDEVTFRSGSTDLSAAITFAANDVREFRNSGAPVFRGRAVSDAFVLNKLNAVQVNGFAVIGEARV